ncbi:hypothetical protein SY88_12445 [Clostridiales bacterium PH28_bin88]|nr:hypothetical protein SY88_12445 [Clostridiales bacterium PH28_bin88]
MSKKVLLVAIVLVVSFALLLTGCGTKQEPAKPQGGEQTSPTPEKWDTIRLLYTESVYSLTSLVAQEKGFFAEERLNVNAQPLPFGGMAVQALVGESADFAVGANARFLSAVNKDLPIRAIGITHWGFSGEFLVPASDTTTKSLKDVVGKRLAVQMGSGSSGVFLRWMEIEGVTPKDFKIIEMDTENIPAAFEKGEVDAALPWVPFSTMLVEKGIARIVVDGNEMSKATNAYYAFPVTTRQDLIEQKPDVVQRFANAWVKAHVFIQKNPDEAAAILRTAWQNLGMEVTEEQVKAAMKYVNTDRSTLTDADVQDMVASAEAFVKYGYEKQAASPEKVKRFIDNSFMEKAEAQFRK